MTKTKKQLIFEVMGFSFASLSLFSVGLVDLISNSSNTSIGYDIIILIGGLVSTLTMWTLRLIGPTKKMDIKKLRTIICYSGIFSLICVILGLAIFQPSIGFSMMGGIIVGAMIVIAHIGSLLINKKEYFKMYKFK